jgi:hypothetical protein
MSAPTMTLTMPAGRNLALRWAIYDRRDKMEATRQMCIEAIAKHRAAVPGISEHDPRLVRLRGNQLSIEAQITHLDEALAELNA